MELAISSSIKPAEDLQDGLLELAFGLGWAAADEAHLPALPEALAQLMGVPAARLAIVRWNGTLLMEHAHPPLEERKSDGPMLLYEVEKSLGTECALRLSVETWTELSPSQSEMFDKALRIIHMALDCILIRQRDRDALGEPFARLSDREWQICEALERPDGEKQIAGSLECSRHTVHGYVKNLYRKLQVRSRLQVREQLKRVREQLRRSALEAFAPVHAAQQEKRGGTKHF